MKITTTISVTIERPDGSASTIGQTSITHAGDNPIFERRAANDTIFSAHAALARAHFLDENENPL